MDKNREQEELSSGAEKVEKITHKGSDVFEDPAAGSELQGGAANGGARHRGDPSTERERLQKIKVERENMRAEKRLEAAKLKAEKKENREQAKLHAQEGRRIRAEVRRARRDQIANETKEQREKRIARE